MDSRYQLTDRADADLFETSLHLARQGSIETAERFIDAVHEQFRRLADYPGMGRAAKNSRRASAASRKASTSFSTVPFKRTF